MTTSYSNRVSARFDALRVTRRRALVCYATAGHPDRVRSLELLKGLESAGADVIEVGVPFSDPLADGPVIQASSQAALAHGMTLDGVLEMVSDAALGVPVVLFTYLNPLLAAGPRALERITAAGCDGLLVTDLPLGGDPALESSIAESPLAFIRLVAPTTPDARIAAIAHAGSGFVYVISRLGVTGTQAVMSDSIAPTVARVRRATDLPVCVGFGVSTAEHARSVGSIADGVVVGSAIVRAAERSVDEAITLVAELRAALDGIAT